MPRHIALPNGDLIVDRRSNIGPQNYSWLLTLVVFLITQTIAGVWWASSINTKMEFVTQAVTELKQAIKEKVN